MDKDCFNMAVRMFACDEAHLYLDDDEGIFHYMDLQFFVST